MKDIITSVPAMPKLKTKPMHFLFNNLSASNLFTSQTLKTFRFRLLLKTTNKISWKNLDFCLPHLYFWNRDCFWHTDYLYPHQTLWTFFPGVIKAIVEQSRDFHLGLVRSYHSFNYSYKYWCESTENWPTFIQGWG